MSLGSLFGRIRVARRVWSLAAAGCALGLATLAAAAAPAPEPPRKEEQKKEQPKKEEPSKRPPAPDLPDLFPDLEKLLEGIEGIDPEQIKEMQKELRKAMEQLQKAFPQGAFQPPRRGMTRGQDGRL